MSHRPLLVLAVALLIADPAGAFDPDRRHHVELGEPRTVRARLRTGIHAPHLRATEWILVTPVPPERPDQTDADADLRVIGGPGTRITPGHEGSDLRRPVLTGRVPVRAGRLLRSIEFEVEYRVGLRPRSLVEGPGPAVAPLDPGERALYLRTSPTVDWGEPGFLDWLRDAGLVRRPGERDLALAWRVFDHVVTEGEYVYPPEERLPSRICRSPRSDCGGLSLLFVAAMRANGIPARTLFGRWAESQAGSRGQWHVKAELFADGVGWVPVELSGALTWGLDDPGRCFGHDRGHFVTLHHDTDLVIDSIHFGATPVPWSQGPLFWVTGRGALDDLRQDSHWEVAILP